MAFLHFHNSIGESLLSEIWAPNLNDNIIRFDLPCQNKAYDCKCVLNIVAAASSVLNTISIISCVTYTYTCIPDGNMQSMKYVSLCLTSSINLKSTML